jgi:GntR family transcriptional regulator
MHVFIRPSTRSGVPIYLQLVRQVTYAIETGALRKGDRLPGIRELAVELRVDPNTVAKAYRRLAADGAVELRHGAGAFVSARAADAVDGRVAGSRALVADVFDTLLAADLEQDEIRRLFEAELTRRFSPPAVSAN